MALMQWSALWILCLAVASLSCAPSSLINPRLGKTLMTVQDSHTVDGDIIYEFLSDEEAHTFTGVVVPAYCFLEDRASKSGHFVLRQQCLVQNGSLVSCEQFDYPTNINLKDIYGSNVSGLSLRHVGVNAFVKTRQSKIGFIGPFSPASRVSRLTPSEIITFEGRIDYLEKYTTYSYFFMNGYVVRTAVYEYQSRTWP